MKIFAKFLSLLILPYFAVRRGIEIIRFDRLERKLLMLDEALKELEWEELMTRMSERNARSRELEINRKKKIIDVSNIDPRKLTKKDYLAKMVKG